MKTTRPATPLEKAIGKVAGFSAPELVPLYLRMRCRNCSAMRMVAAHESWPEGTNEVTFEHFDCKKPGKILRIKFMGRTGAELQR